MRIAARVGLVPFPLGVTYDARALRDALERVHLDVTATTAIVHHPRMFGTALIRVTRALGSPALIRWACQWLLSLQRFQDTRWQYLTGCFVAACAVKPGQRGGAA